MKMCSCVHRVKEGAAVAMALAITSLLGWGGRGAAQEQLLNDATGQQVVRTCLEGLRYRETQPSRLVGEAVLSSYLGPSFRAVLAKASDRDTPEEYRDRDRAIIRFDLSDSQYGVEVQALYWGGSNCFLMANPQRGEHDVGELYLMRGVTRDGTFYHFSRQEGYPTGWYRPIQGTPSGFYQDWPSVWLGTSGKRPGPLSEEVRQSIDDAIGHRCDKIVWNDLSCFRLSLYKKSTVSNHVERLRYWFVPQYDFALVQRERIGFDTDNRNSAFRYIEAWRNFEAVSGLPSLVPRRYTGWDFTYSTQSEHAIARIVDAQITVLSSPESSPRQDVPTLFPPGTRLVSPMDTPGKVSPDYERMVRDAMTIEIETQRWAEQPWEEALPAFPEEWSEGLSGETINDIVAGAGVNKEGQ